MGLGFVAMLDGRDHRPAGNPARADSQAGWCGLPSKESTHQRPFAAAIRLFPRARAGTACPQAARRWLRTGYPSSMTSAERACAAIMLKWESDLWNELRPDRDHPHKQRDRRQRRCLFHENLQHCHLPIIWNITGTMFYFCSGVKRGLAGQFGK